jgi:hypothetical protein
MSVPIPLIPPWQSCTKIVQLLPRVLPQSPQKSTNFRQRRPTEVIEKYSGGRVFAKSRVWSPTDWTTSQQLKRKNLSTFLRGEGSTLFAVGEQTFFILASFIEARHTPLLRPSRIRNSSRNVASSAARELSSRKNAAVCEGSRTRAGKGKRFQYRSRQWPQLVDPLRD